MSVENIYRLIQFDEYSVTPKYLQLTQSILKGIDEGKLEKDYILPSINDLSYELEISRNTAEKAYRYLKQLGIVSSVPGKGYFIARSDFKQSIKVFLLFNKLSAHKKIIYDSFVATLGSQATVDFYIYNNDYLLFKRLLTNPKENYDYYVIIPHFLEGGEKAHEIINKIPKEKLVLLDKLLPGIEGEYSAIYENFEKDIFCALEKARTALSRYRMLKIIFPENTYYPAEILKGFIRFCQEYAFSYKIVHRIEEEPIEAGDLYLNVMEDDLVVLIERIISLKLEIAKDVGVISYNDTPLKKIILNGITTISTDFQQMGELAAKLIIEKSKVRMEVPFHLTLRPSL
jgi:DNA-binding transcriptional regulator YhcF (GntR family)